MSPPIAACQHTRLHLDVSANTKQCGFKRPSKQQRIAAARLHDTPTAESLLTPIHLFDDLNTFPAPLVLPDDDLDIDPDWPPQSVKEWHDEEERNPVTPKRKTIYLVSPPSISKEMAKMKDWISPQTTVASTGSQQLKVADLQKYISAFYHGMTVKILNKPFSWRQWHEDDAKKSKSYDGRLLRLNQHALIGLQTPQNTMVGIQCRLSPDEVAMQVNLDNVLDALAENVPSDAYAIMMLLDIDMYEGDDDVFTGGRAYGASRIAVVSSFRDNPMHSYSSQSLLHRWPVSHSQRYVPSLCRGIAAGKTPPQPSSGAMKGALDAVVALPPKEPTAKGAYIEWLGRVAQTMAHELGHCFGLDHCVYYACAMQGCASSAEALRQPPYLCPVCLEKVATAIGGVLVKGWENHQVRQRYIQNRYSAIRDSCQLWKEQTVNAFWVGQRAWLDDIILP
ncbi:hypothetical protein VHEMI09207 [[Torrubiella] hemipterigena]|uniref:Archaemetzincin-2 n=1 Tax=[Torrubiella] hemipterigena TaxID=1531966 RepID=A0A0A1TFT1_9HYPO|nr:hypothetical protein VHEMI09207 [[Torrubiella] hemipterigena]